MNYKNLAPEDSFIGQYMRHMSYLETPYAYDFWAAVWAIGACCGREVFVDRPRTPVRFNWYIIFASESGTTRKSTAVRAITELVKEVGDTFIINNKLPPEGLMHKLAAQSRAKGSAECFIVPPELVTLLGREGYMVNMPALLTDLYDCPEFVDGGGTIDGLTREVRKCYVCMLSASTPSWLITAINPQVIEGGFTSRVIFVAAKSRKRSIPWPADRDYSTESIVVELNQIVREARDINGIQPSKSGLERYTSWYRTRHAHKDPFRGSFESREDDHVLRLAGCLAINDRSFQISRRHINTAIKVINDVKCEAFELFGGGSVDSIGLRLGDGIDKVRQELVKAGMNGIRHNNLYKSVRHKIDSKEFNLLMTVMHEAGLIQTFEIKGTRGKIYRGTKHLESVGATTTILGKIAPSTKAS